MWRIKIGRSLASRAVLVTLGCCLALTSAHSAFADPELDRLEAFGSRETTRGLRKS